MDEETNVEIDVINKFKKDAQLRGDKVLEFCNYGKVVFDTEGFNFTKVTGAKLIIGGRVTPLEKTTTWAALLRSVNKATDIGKHNDVYEECFNDTIRDVVETYGLGMNHNFSMELYTDDSYINSSLYRNNQNHKLEVVNGKYICAVYSGEVVVVLNALIMSMGLDGYDDRVTLLVSYKRREDVSDVESESVSDVSCDDVEDGDVGDVDVVGLKSVVEHIEGELRYLRRIIERVESRK